MTNKVEMTVTATDEAPKQTRAERAKFKLQFMQMMLMSGRIEDAETALGQCYDLLDAMIEDGQ